MRLLFATLLCLVMLEIRVDSADLITTPGFGLFGDENSSFVEVEKTANGARVHIFLQEGGPDPPHFGVSWPSDVWSQITVHERRYDANRQFVSDFFNPFFTDGPFGVAEGETVTLPANVSGRRYGYGLDTDYALCQICTGSFWFEYSVINIPSPPPGDFNVDGKVDFADFLILSHNFGPTQAVITWDDGDANSDQQVNFDDFLILQENFGTIRDSQPAAVPEPTTLPLLASACLGLAVFRRRRLA